MGRGKSGTSPGWDHPPSPRPSFTGPENLLLDKSAFYEPVKLGLIDRCRVHSTVTTGRRYSVDDNLPWRRLDFETWVPSCCGLGPSLATFASSSCLQGGEGQVMIPLRGAPICPYYFGLR